MSARSRYRVILLLVGLPLCLFVAKTFERQCLSVHSVHVSCAVSVTGPTKLVLYHANGNGWQPDHRVEASVPGGRGPYLVRFPVIHTDSLTALRLDLSGSNGQIAVGTVLVKGPGDTALLAVDTARMSMHDLALAGRSPKGRLSFIRTGAAPELEFDRISDHLDLGHYPLPDQIRMGALLLLLLSLMLWLWFRSGVPGWAEGIRLHQAMFAIFFIGAIAVHWLCLPTGLSEVDPYLERRTLKPFPTDTTTDLAAGMGAWFEDRFAIRQQLTRLKSWTDYFWLDKSAVPHKTVLGRNKELYPSSLFLLDDFMGKMKLSEAQLTSIRRNLRERILYMRAKGKDYYLMFTPSKQTVYPKDLPLRFRRHHQPEKTMLSQLMAYLKEDTLVAPYVCDTRSMLEQQAAVSKRRLYFQDDIHWNALGAFIGYRQLAQLIHLRHPSVRVLDRMEFDVTMHRDHQGDLARSLMLQKDLTRTNFEFHKKQGPHFNTENEWSVPDYMLVHTTFPDSTLPTALIFRDSFCVDLIPFLSYDFSDVLYVWDPAFNVELIEKRKPDIVIQEITEMFIYELLTVNPNSMQDHG